MYKLVFLACLLPLVLGQSPLTLNQAASGSFTAPGESNYTYAYSKTDFSYQNLLVVPVTAFQPLVTIYNSTWQAQLDCSSTLNSFNGQARCSFSFQGCLEVPEPEQYSITVTAPHGVVGEENFNIEVIRVDSTFSATDNVKTIQACCGYQGAAWHYVQSTDTEIAANFTITLTNGTLTPAIGDSGLGFLPPGIFVIPADACANFGNIFDLQNLPADLLQASYTFKGAFSVGRNGESVSYTLDLQTSSKDANVDWWVLVVPDKSSSAQYTATVGYNTDSGAASSLLPFALPFSLPFSLPF